MIIALIIGALFAVMPVEHKVPVKKEAERMVVVWPSPQEHLRFKLDDIK